MRKKTRSLRLENLESRQMMAGDVTAEVVSGDLMVTGHDRNLDTNNEVEIYRYSSGDLAGWYRVRGLNGTRINGVADGQTFFTPSQVVDDIRVDLGVGNDRLTVYNARLTGSHSDMVIDAGVGHDMVSIHNANVARDVSLEMEGGDNVFDGNDVVGVYFSTIGDDLIIRTRDGLDEVGVAHTSVGDDLWIETGEHRDEVELSYVDAVDRITAHLGDGDDWLWVYRTNAQEGDFRGQDGSDTMQKSSSNFDFINWTYGNDDNWD